MTPPGPGVADPGPKLLLAASRRRLVAESIGISLSAGAFGLVYGLACRGAGFSLIEALAMSVFVLAGSSQFAAVGLVMQGVAWPAIVLLTALLNSRHILYSASLAPWVAKQPRVERAAMAHTLTDETFALSSAHFIRIGRADVPGYWIASAFVVLPWIGMTVVGLLGGQAIPDPTTFGLDIVFPAAMAGLAVALVHGRRELVASIVGAAVAVSIGLASSPSVGIVVGGLLGPLAGMAIGRGKPESDLGAATGGRSNPPPRSDPAIGTTP